MSKYWKNSSGIYIKRSGAYPKCVSCPCGCTGGVSLSVGAGPAWCSLVPCEWNPYSHWLLSEYTWLAQDIDMTLLSANSWQGTLYWQKRERHWPTAAGDCTGAPEFDQTYTPTKYIYLTQDGGDPWHWIITIEGGGYCGTSPESIGPEETECPFGSYTGDFTAEVAA